MNRKRVSRNATQGSCCQVTNSYTRMRFKLHAGSKPFKQDIMSNWSPRPKYEGWAATQNSLSGQKNGTVPITPLIVLYSPHLSNPQQQGNRDSWSVFVAVARNAQTVGIKNWAQQPRNWTVSAPVIRLSSTSYRRLSNLYSLTHQLITHSDSEDHWFGAAW